MVSRLAALTLLPLVASLQLQSDGGEASVAASEAEFRQFVAQHRRTYVAGSHEYIQRMAIFSKHLRRAELLNARPNQSWTAGVTPLADYLTEELQMLRGRKGASSSASTASGQSPRLNLLQQQEPREWLKWSQLQTFQAVASQGFCGSCWAMATTNVLNAHREIYLNITERLSPQELVNCVANPKNCGGSGGCSGATTELAMAYVQQYGLSKEADHPYNGKDGLCRGGMPGTSVMHGREDESEGFKRLKMHGWQKLPENKYEPLKIALVTRGPVAVSVAAKGWEMYVSGIYSDCQPDVVIDHAVTLIAYGEDQDLKKKYWTLMNSWGASYGESGTIRLLRQDAEEAYCGIDRQPQVGTGCDGGPEEVRVCGTCGILYDTVVPIFAAETEK